MRNQIYNYNREKCVNCRHDNPDYKFKFIDLPKGRTDIFSKQPHSYVVLILSGKLNVGYDVFQNRIFKEGEMMLLLANTDIAVEVIDSASIFIVRSEDGMTVCNVEVPVVQLPEISLKYDFRPLDMRPPVREFVKSIQTYISDEIVCQKLFSIKEKELAYIFHSYYTKMELLAFFYPLLIKGMDFAKLVLKNYNIATSLPELAEMCGYNLRTFNRKFKEQFNDTPYQWILKQNSIKIKRILIEENTPVKVISEHFGFSDTSHFNRYCKSMYGMSPTQLRDMFNKLKLSK